MIDLHRILNDIVPIETQGWQGHGAVTDYGEEAARQVWTAP